MIKNVLLLGCVGLALIAPGAASAHSVQPAAVTVVRVVAAALGAFGVIAVGAMIARLRRSISPRVDLLLTSSLAMSALVALMAFVAAQFIPASVTLSLDTSTP